MVIIRYIKYKIRVHECCKLQSELQNSRCIYKDQDVGKLKSLKVK